MKLTMKLPRFGFPREKTVLSLGLTGQQLPQIPEGEEPKVQPMAERARDVTTDTVRADLKHLHGEVQRLHTEVERLRSEVDRLATAAVNEVSAGVVAPDSILPPVPPGFPAGASTDALDPGLDAFFPQSERR